MRNYTEDLSKIIACPTERAEVLEILTAWQKYGLPENFSDDNVRFAFNANSGYVFLVNDDYQVAMHNGERLELWLNLPDCGEEGFIQDFLPDIKAGIYSNDDCEYIIYNYKALENPKDFLNEEDIAYLEAAFQLLKQPF